MGATLVLRQVIITTTIEGCCSNTKTYATMHLLIQSQGVNRGEGSGEKYFVEGSYYDSETLSGA
jgi:hypothetical protein